MNKIEEEMSLLIDEEWVPGICCATGNIEKNIIKSKGYIDNFKETIISHDSLVDLASVSKIFTAIVYLKLHEDKCLSIYDSIGKYTEKFKNIKSIKIYELMNFSFQLKTKKRIFECVNRKEALNCLYNIEIMDKSVNYTDMGCMVLAELINIIYNSDKAFKEKIREIFTICGMNNSYIYDNLTLINKVPSYDDEIKFQNGEIKYYRSIKGKPHDKKAHFLLGHSGVFSTVGDMVLFSQSLLKGNIIQLETLNLMTDYKICSENNRQNYGLLCFMKNKRNDFIDSEVPSSASDSAFAISGYTGTYFLLDIENGKFVIITANRIHNKVTYCDDKSLIINNELSINGKIYIVTEKYAYKKDCLRNYLYDWT